MPAEETCASEKVCYNAMGCVDIEDSSQMGLKRR